MHELHMPWVYCSALPKFEQGVELKARHGAPNS